MSKRGLIISLSVFVVVLISGFLFLKPVFNSLSAYLSKSEPVKANILLVEGWLPDYALDMSYQEFNKNRYDYIVTTGLKMITDYYQVAMNGYLIFYPNDKLKNIGNSDNHIIEIEAYSEMGGDYSAHFNLFLNDSLIADFYADEHKRRYTYKWEGSLSGIDSIMIQLTNDRVDEKGDVNFYVKDIIIDHNTKIPYMNNTVYDIGALDGVKRIVNNFNSCAESARKRFMSMGIDSSVIIAVPVNRVITNRTLTSAISFRDWLKTININVKGINIVSMGTHARRTWITYNKILDEKYNIGIISLPDYGNNYSMTSRVLTTIRQTLGIIYYWFLLIPY
jgi:hypothetical protein